MLTSKKARVKTAEKKVKFSHYSKFADKIRQAFSMCYNQGTLYFDSPNENNYEPNVADWTTCKPAF